MKKLLSIVLALLLVMTLVLPAFAEDEAQLATTKDFIRVLDEQGIQYEYIGMTSSGDYEKITVSYSSDLYEDYTYRFFFDTDSNMVNIRLWYLITITADKADALQVINSLNSEWKWAKFCYDESDDTLTVEADVMVSDVNPGDLVYAVMCRLYNVLSYEEVQTPLATLK